MRRLLFGKEGLGLTIPLYENIVSIVPTPSIEVDFKLAKSRRYWAKSVVVPRLLNPPFLSLGPAPTFPIQALHFPQRAIIEHRFK